MNLEIDIDELTTSMEALLKSGAKIPVSDLRIFQAKMIAAMAVLNARARGNRVFYPVGVPNDADGQEGDLALNKVNGDLYSFEGGTFGLLFNILPGEGTSGPSTSITGQLLAVDPDTDELLILLSPDAPTNLASYVLAGYDTSVPPPPPPPASGGFPYSFPFTF